MKRVDIGDHTLYCGNCIDVFDDWNRDVRISHIITDPPYAAEAHTKQRRVLGKGITKCRELTNQPLPFEALTAEVQEQLCIFAAQQCDGWLIAFCQAESIGDWKRAMEEWGIHWRRAGVWVKPDSSPQLSGDCPAVGHEAIAIAWCGDGRSTWNGGGSRAVWTFSKHDAGSGHGGAVNEHPTQKPLALMEKLVSQFTLPDQVIIDPFMGSGTTGVACVNLGRIFIGVETNKEYFDIACKRIAAAHAQQRLFA